MPSTSWAWLENRRIAQMSLRDSAEWLDQQRHTYPFRAMPVSVKDIDPRHTKAPCCSAVLAPGLRTFAFRHRADRDEFEKRYRT